MGASKLRTDGERKKLSDNADLIMNDTDDGVNVVVENRDKDTYILRFNFTQSENLNFFPKGSTILTDEMKCTLEAPGHGVVSEVGDFVVSDEEVTSIAVAYRVQCLIRNQRGELEECASAVEKVKDLPEEVMKVNDDIDLIYVKTNKGYMTYLHNKGGPANVKLDFGIGKNLAISPLSRAITFLGSLIAEANVSRTSRIEFLEITPMTRGPMELKFKVVSIGLPSLGKFPVPLDKLEKPLQDSTAKTTAVDKIAAGPMPEFFGSGTFEHEFGGPGPHDAGTDTKKWTVYKWVFVKWEEERNARIALEREYKASFEAFLRQWYQSVCNICRNLLVGDHNVVQYKEYRLHKSCYDKAGKCDVCNEILVGEYVIAKGAKGETKLHKACVDAYKRRTRPKCETCGKQIMDPKWRTDAATKKTYHLNCRKFVIKS